MKKLILPLLMVLLLPAISNGQEYVSICNTQHQYDTQYTEAKMK